MKNKSLFIIWKIYQRRAESLSHRLDLKVEYIHFKWEEKTRFHKLLSYVFKSLVTIKLLVMYRPKVLFVQLPPTFLLYIASVYKILFGVKLIADCHNAMIDSSWRKLPLATYFLNKSDLVLVHNKAIQMVAKNANIDAEVSHDPLPIVGDLATNLEDKYGVKPYSYVLVPWNFAKDEPLSELIETCRKLPEVTFVATWFYERLPAWMLNDKPKNLIFTGYLESSQFNAMISNAGALLALTIREGTQLSSASEAIAYGVPLVISNMKISSELYGDKVTYVANDPDSISSGIVEVLSNMDKKRKNMAELKLLFENKTDKEMQHVIHKLALVNG